MSISAAGYAVGIVGCVFYLSMALRATLQARHALRLLSEVGERAAIVDEWVSRMSRAETVLDVFIMGAAFLLLLGAPSGLARGGWLLFPLSVFLWLAKGRATELNRRNAPRMLGLGTLHQERAPGSPDV